MIVTTIIILGLMAVALEVGYQWGHKEGTRVAYADARRLILEHPTKALCYMGPRTRVTVPATRKEEEY